MAWRAFRSCRLPGLRPLEAGPRFLRRVAPCLGTGIACSTVRLCGGTRLGGLRHHTLALTAEALWSRSPIPRYPVERRPQSYIKSASSARCCLASFRFRPHSRAMLQPCARKAIDHRPRYMLQSKARFRRLSSPKGHRWQCLQIDS